MTMFKKIVDVNRLSCFHLLSLFCIIIAFTLIESSSLPSIATQSFRRPKINSNSHKTPGIKFNLDVGWPLDEHLGQVVAIDIDKDGNVVIFHRGSHVWNERSFDLGEKYLQQNQGPISVDTILTIDSVSRVVIKRWGRDFFYLPHGLTFDTKGFVWLTDVALHQVFKFPAQGPSDANEIIPILKLGERFVPGNDDSHFCKPTSVAVDSKSGEFYVADGYCNSRIIRFDSSGKFLNQWGHPDIPDSPLSPTAFKIPHKVVLIESRRLACIADREHGRILCFHLPHGEYRLSIERKEFDRLFSISHSPQCDDLLFAVSGQSFSETSHPVAGFIFNLTDQRLMGTFTPPREFDSFKQPHDIVSSAQCDTAYVTEIGPNRVWKFSRVSLSALSPQTGDILAKNLLKADTTKSPTAEDKTDSNEHMIRKSSILVIPKVLATSYRYKVAAILIASLLIIGICWCARNYLILLGVPRMSLYKAKVSESKMKLTRFLDNPEKSGFNRIPLGESDEADGHSDSEVEEFNISSLKKV